MGLQNIDAEQDAALKQQYMKKLLQDVHALEQMLADDLIESDVRRIGAEQELVLVDKNLRPAAIAQQILSELGDPHFTNELGLFNLEFNADPLIFTGDCLTALEMQMSRFLSSLRKVVNQHGGEVVLTGILPTFRKSDLEMRNITPKPRYYQLDNVLKNMRGNVPIEFDIKGIDELHIRHDSVMLEACNTSFQVHFQAPPKEYVKYYNISLAVAGPVLAVAVNSPFLFGKRLWKETRIPVFQKTIDTRSTKSFPRSLPARVSFGSHWLENSVVEIYQEDIARFRTFFSSEIDENAFDELARGALPKLKALQLFNSSVYRWMRPCYGITDGKAHLRIENRIFPSGPTIRDEVANAAFWLGLVHGMAEEIDDVSSEIDFDDASANFFAAASQGMESQFTWFGGKTLTADQLIRQKLLPLARKGLERAQVSESEIDKYLGIIEARAAKGKTGARWMLDSFDGMKDHNNTEHAMNAITAGLLTREQQGQPVHLWSLAKQEEAGHWQGSYQRVEQFMSTDFYTVGADEPVDLVASLMVWKRIRYVPVEDHQHRLLGLVSYRSLVKLLLKHLSDQKDKPASVSAIMIHNPVTISPDSSALQAIELMRAKKVGCLPVVEKGRIVGLVTEGVFMNLSRQLIESKLKAGDGGEN